MPLSEDAARDVVKDLLKVRQAELERLTKIRAYMSGEICKVYSPRRTTREYRQIVEMSKVNILPLVVSAFAENLFVEGYRPAKKAQNAKSWDEWQANRMDMRQGLIYRSALTYGLSYATVLKKKGGGSLITPYSPLQLTAVYDDPVNDEWPVYTIACSDGYDPVERRREFRVDLLDGADGDGWKYRFTKSGEGEYEYDPEESGAHGMPVVPVVRYVNAGMDLDEGPASEVEPLFPLQDQLDQTTYGLLIAQQFAAFRQRWVTGMTVEEDPDGNPREPFNVGVDRVIQGESPDTKFGEFDQTDLSGYLNSRQSTLRIISARAQLAPHSLLVSDGVTNLSAEALAALESAQQRKTTEQKTSFGEANEQLMRLASAAADIAGGWDDTSAQVVWRDTESRSMAQVADAYGKMAQMLAIPPRALWPRLPGFTEQDVQLMEAMADKEDGLAQQAMDNAQPPQMPPDQMQQMMAQGGGNVVSAGPAGPTGGQQPARAARAARTPVPAGR